MATKRIDEDERQKAVMRAIWEEPGRLKTLRDAADKVGIDYRHFTMIARHGIPRRARPRTVERLKRLPRVYAALRKLST